MGKGGLGGVKPAIQVRNPFDTVSIHLVKIASHDIEYESYANAAYLTFIPVGWYATEYTVAIEENGSEEFVSCTESIGVYNFNHYKFEELIEYLLKEDLAEWADESLEDDALLSIASNYVTKFFDVEQDNLDGNLYKNVIKLIRHIAQNGNKPEFLNFNQRNVYDLDRIAAELIDTPPRECHTYLKNLFNNEGLLWKVLYRDYTYFKKAFDHAINRLLNDGEMELVSPLPEPIPLDPGHTLTDEVRQQVYKRDNYQCLCCGKERRRGVSLEIDHILPIAMGGKNAPSNLQTLCKQCNGLKGVNEIDYRSIISPLSKPKEMILFAAPESDYVENAIARIVNHIYHCRAFCSLNYSERRNGKYYDNWGINLYSGNNPQWIEQHSSKLLEYINQELGWTNVRKIIIND
ncbi:HNH endonuclease [Ectobacillus funiculus]